MSGHDLRLTMNHGHRCSKRLHVHLEDLLASLDVGQPHGDPSVEAARAQQRVVQDVGAYGGAGVGQGGGGMVVGWGRTGWGRAG